MSGKDVMHNMAMNIGESIVPASVSICEARVVDTKQVQNRRMEVMHMDTIFRDRRTDLVGTAIARAALDATARQP